MQAAVLLDFVEAAELHALFEQRYHTITGHRVQDRHGEDWQTFFVFPSLPLFAKAAPVHPTTKN